MLKSIDYLWRDRKRYMRIPMSFTKYALSDDRLFIETGVFNLKMDEVLLYRVKDISVKINLWQRIFGMGTVVILSSDQSCPELIFKNVKAPQETKELIHNTVEKCKIERHVRISDISGDYDDDDCDCACDGEK